jgi:hypothetical protein
MTSHLYLNPPARYPRRDDARGTVICARAMTARQTLVSAVGFASGTMERVVPALDSHNFIAKTSRNDKFEIHVQFANTLSSHTRTLGYLQGLV